MKDPLFQIIKMPLAEKAMPQPLNVFTNFECIPALSFIRRKINSFVEDSKKLEKGFFLSCWVASKICIKPTHFEVPAVERRESRRTIKRSKEHPFPFTIKDHPKNTIKVMIHFLLHIINHGFRSNYAWVIYSVKSRVVGQSCKLFKLSTWHFT